jgi:hypothetical protein
MSYEQWQLEKKGNITPTKKSNLRQDEDEVDNEQNSDFDFVADANVFDDLTIKSKENG